MTLLKEKPAPTILIVDDDPNILELLKESLEDLSFKVLMAQNGKEALDIFHTHHVDCLVTDISMPLVDGPELIRTLLSEGHQVPFFFITAYQDYPKENLNVYKPRAIIFKPFDFEELALLVKNHMMRL